MIFLLLFACLIALIVPIYHVRKILHEDERKYLNMLKQNQRKAYYITLVGTLMLSFIVTLSLVILVINGIQMIIGDPTGVGYTLALFIVPFLIIATIGSVTVYVPFKHSVPSVFVYNHQLANIILLIISIVSFFIIAALGYFLFLGIESLIGFSKGEVGFVEILEGKSFHLVKILFYSIFIAPALMLTGGALGLLSRRRKRIRHKKN